MSKSPPILALANVSKVFGAAKADQAHQVRLLAAELGGHGIRVNGVNPDGVVRGFGIFAGGWGAQRAAVYGVPEDRLGEFYAQRTLLKREVLPEHVANAVYALSGFTTFSVLPHPDGGPSWAEGTVPTPHVDISAAWRRGADSFTLAVTAPDQTTAVAGVPASDVTPLTVNGWVVWQDGTSRSAEVHLADGYIQVTGVTGSTTLHATIG
jgi:hypothetical protein